MVKHGAKIFFTVSVFVLGCTFGFLANQSNNQQSTDKANSQFSSEVRLQSNYRYINPLLECVEKIGNFKFPKDIEENVNKYITQQQKSNKITTVAVYYRDLNNGPWMGINANTLFTPASLIKVPLMITYYKKAESDPEILDKVIRVKSKTPQLVSEVNIKPKSQVTPGIEYTVDELVESMIINSDNIAYITLKENLSKDEFYRTFSDFGIDVEKIESSKSDNVLSIIDYSSFFRILYNASYLNKTLSEKALRLLSQTDYNEGIIAGLPNGTSAAHKFGERYYPNTKEKQLHDCGIVYKGTHPYLVCIMTRGNEFDDLAETISGISKIIYNSVI